MENVDEKVVVPQSRAVRGIVHNSPGDGVFTRGDREK
jgi:hypothetical protein